jgi:regulator of replication initiation timing
MFFLGEAKMDIELAQALEENADLKDENTELKELLKQFIPYRRVIDSVVFKELAERAENLLESLEINPEDRFEVTEEGKEYLRSH